MKILKIITVLFALLLSQPAFCTDWTILIFVQAKNNLCKFAAQNLSDMAKIGSNNNVNILVQWYQPGQNGIWRYKIEKNKIELDIHLPQNSDGSNSVELVDSMRWAVNKYPADNYFLVLWNHGVGILDPVWGGSGRMGLNPFITNNNPKAQITGLTKNFESEFTTPSQMHQRGILFNELNRTYMNNQELAQALKEIKTDVLKNRKLDILGMDACLMAMVEVGYQVRNYAKYMVASQEVELANGWNYLSLLEGLTYGKMNSISLAQSIVLTYEQYYKNKIQFYTQSAIDLENIDTVKDGLNQVIKDINEFKKYDKMKLQQIIKSSRASSVQFSNRNYVDLYSFYSQLHKKIDATYNQAYLNKIRIQKTRNSITKAAKDLKESLTLSMKLINNSVVAKTAGKNLAGAQGLSIYFPYGKIDNSYIKTEFAQDSLWVKFLQETFSR